MNLIAATGLVILLKLDSNRRFFSSCDLEIWWMTLLKYYMKLCASFQFKSICEFKLELQSRIAQFGHFGWFFLSHVTMKFDVWLWKTIEPLFYTTSSFVHTTMNVSTKFQINHWEVCLKMRGTPKVWQTKEQTDVKGHSNNPPQWPTHGDTTIGRVKKKNSPTNVQQLKACKAGKILL